MTNHMDKLPEIDTERLRLRMSSSDDVQAVYEIYSHPDVIRHWDHPIWTNSAQASDFIRAAHDGFLKCNLFVWCMSLKGSGVVIGTCALRDYSREHRTAEVLCAFHPTHWGRGFLSEVLPGLVTFGFGSLDLNRLYAPVLPPNTASRKALERVGFKLEGRLRESWIYPGEGPTDTLVYGLIRSDLFGVNGA